jgi:hypothetical protein
MKIDERYKEWATDRQREVIDAVNTTGGIRSAARLLGYSSEGSVRNQLKLVVRKAGIHGFSPDYDLDKPTPPGQLLKGASTLYKDGKPVMQWVKTTLDLQEVERATREAVAALAEDVKREKPVKAPKHTEDALCNLYTFTDCHVGMMAWAPESGEDWDLKIAEETLMGAFEHLIAASPKAQTCVVAQLGDFLHYDSLAPVTPTSGHIVDADGRYSKVIRVAVRVLRAIITKALSRHEKVIVLMAEGNHDMASSVWLRHLFGLLYENEPRVSVIDSEMPYYVHQHGQTMLGFHHGHLKKNEALPLLFAAQFAKTWGATTKRYAHTGHRHHVEEKEHSGMTVVQHATLAARDAYAARGGWISDRQITSITYHDRYGQVARNTVVPEMLTS